MNLRKRALGGSPLKRGPIGLVNAGRLDNSANSASCGTLFRTVAVCEMGGIGTRGACTDLAQTGAVFYQ